VLLLSHFTSAKPTGESVSNLLSREKNGTLQDSYYIYELYKDCGTTEEVLELSRLLKSEFNSPIQQNRNIVATSKRLSSLGKHRQAIQLLKQLHNQNFSKLTPSIRSEYYHALGHISLNSGNPKLSLDYYTKAATISSGTNNKELYQSHLSAIGIASNAIGNPKKAMFYFNKALKLETSGENRNSLYLQLNVALTHINLGNIEKAKAKFLATIPLIKARNDAYAEIRTLGNLGDIYFQQDSVDLAITSYLKAKELALSNNQLLDLIRINTSLSEAYEKLGNSDQALSLLKKAIAIEDELNQGISESLPALELAQDINGLDKINSTIKYERDQEAKLKRLLLIALITVVLISSLLLSYIIRFKKKKRHLLKRELSSTKKSKPSDQIQFLEITQQLEQLIIKDELFKQTGVTLDQIAKSIGTNRSYLSEAINSHYQVSLTQWLNHIRIESAKALLADPKNHYLSIEGISKTVGFSSISTFNSNFKLETGLTPSYFRKNANI
jgi:AraC-like DNA-binding protein